MSIEFTVLVSIIISVITVLYNIFDYDYYNSITSNDYLESNHNMSIEYDTRKWSELSKLKKVNTHNLKLTKKLNLN